MVFRRLVVIFVQDTQENVRIEVSHALINDVVWFVEAHRVYPNEHGECHCVDDAMLCAHL